MSADRPGTRRALALATTLTVPLVASTVTSPPARAEAATCRGETATIVGTTYGQRLEGTDGRDVIVSGGARRIDAGAGDDLICLTAGRADGTYDVQAGAGDDEVHLETTVPNSDYLVALDDRDETTPGDDVFTGARSSVGISTRGGSDDIDTGTGDARIYLSTSEPFDGRVQMPGGGLVRLFGPVAIDAEIGTGAPASLWLEHDDDGEWVVDSAARTATRDGVPAIAWTGPFTGFDWGATAITFRGSDADERLAGDRVLEAATGGGDDHVMLRSSVLPASLDGGPGTDELLLFTAGYLEPRPGPRAARQEGVGAVTLDLRRESLVVDDAPAMPLVGIEDAYVGPGRPITMIGDDGPNRLRAYGCRLLLQGRGGDDVLQNTNASEDDPGCSPATARIEGGDGDDRLVGGIRDDTLLGGPGDDVFRAAGPMTAFGGAGDDRMFAAISGPKIGSVLHGQAGRDLLVGGRARDRLIGGPGRDEARGKDGRDVCRAEKRRSCER